MLFKMLLQMNGNEIVMLRMLEKVVIGESRGICHNYYPVAARLEKEKVKVCGNCLKLWI
jgi:hypothetical protein